MTKIHFVYTFILLCLTVSSTAQNGVFKIFYYDTTRFSFLTHTVINPPKKGIVQVLIDTSDSKTIRYQAIYSNGKKHGKEFIFDYKSSLLLEGNYSKGRKSGLFLKKDVVYGSNSRNSFFEHKNDYLNGFSGYYSDGGTGYVQFNIGLFANNKKNDFWVTFRKKNEWGVVNDSFTIYSIAKYTNGLETEKLVIPDRPGNNTGRIKLVSWGMYYSEDFLWKKGLTSYKIYDGNKLKSIIYSNYNLDTIMFLTIDRISYYTDSSEMFDVGSIQSYSEELKDDFNSISGKLYLIIRDRYHTFDISKGELGSFDKQFLKKEFDLEFDIGVGLKQAR